MRRQEEGLQAGVRVRLRTGARRRSAGEGMSRRGVVLLGEGERLEMRTGSVTAFQAM